MRAPGCYSGLSVKEAQLLSFLRTREVNKQPQPTFVEMCEHLEVASGSTVSRLLSILETRDFITRSDDPRPVITCVDRSGNPSDPSRQSIRSRLAPFTIAQLVEEIGARGLKVMAA